MHDLVIENAQVIDGLGGRAIQGGVAIKYIRSGLSGDLQPESNPRVQGSTQP
jgi:hypothetical protein